MLPVSTVTAMYVNFFKPLIDITCAFLVLVILSPIIIGTAILLAIVNGGNPFFLQSRGGKGNTVFKVFKFKTMNDKRDAEGNLLPDNVRLTWAGRIVRKLSLDELPQLINILKGDMSLIGPRPFIAQYLSIYNETQKRRHEVKPGITGWAQVNGRNTISWKQKLEYDVWYVDNISFWLDVKIVLRTIHKLFKPGDVNQSESTTAEYFNGNN
jgi:undecaprenyl phosphate N,N'-diacetylbacillosamine 1-phosphate transferase